MRPQGLYLKQYDPSRHCFAYLNQRTGEWSYAKPAFLKADEDIEDPPDEWQMLYNEYGDVYYFNPYRGISSWINDIQVGEYRTHRIGGPNADRLPIVYKSGSAPRDKKIWGART